MMRFSMAVGIVLVGISVNGLAQQKSTVKVKPTHPEAKAPKSNVPIGKTTGGAAGMSVTKDLQNVERQSAKSAASKTVGKKSTRTVPAPKLARDKPSPPINFGGNGGKRAGSTNQAANPYKARLRQKHSHQ